MKMHHPITALALLMTGVLIGTPAFHAADLKQLAEQLVNKREHPKDPRGHAMIRDGGRTVGAGQRNAAPATGKGRIAIQEEGANVKKEKGVEDVE